MATLWSSTGGVGLAIAITGAVLFVIRLAFQPMRARGPVLRESDREVRARRAEQKALEQTISELTDQLQKLEAASLARSVSVAAVETVEAPADGDVAVLTPASSEGDRPADVTSPGWGSEGEAAGEVGQKSAGPLLDMPRPGALRGPRRPVSIDDSAIYQLPNARPSTEPGGPTPLPPITDRFPSVFELADEGKPAIAIARSMNMPLGEVELLLSLRRYSMPDPVRQPVTIQAS